MPTARVSHRAGRRLVTFGAIGPFGAQIAKQKSLLEFVDYARLRAVAAGSEPRRSPGSYYGIPEASAITAADGSYTVTGLIPGLSHVEFIATGYASQWWNNEPDFAHSDLLNVPSGGAATVNAALTPLG